MDYGGDFREKVGLLFSNYSAIEEKWK